MKELWKDYTYNKIQKEYKVGINWDKLCAYIYREYHYTPTEFIEEFPKFLNDFYFGDGSPYEISADTPESEKYLFRRLDEFINQQQLTIKKKRLVTKIL